MSSDEERKIKATFVLDVIGKPPKHLVESLERVSEEMGKQKGVKLKSKRIKEPTTLKDRPDFYTTFAEIDLEFDDMTFLMICIFKYMPAHIEIVEPEIIGLTNNFLNDSLNEITRRLHGYDEIARILQMENKKLREMVTQSTGVPTQTPLSPRENIKSTKKVAVKTNKRKKRKKASKKPSKKSLKNKKK
jgi:hypothetical protein